MAKERDPYFTDLINLTKYVGTLTYQINDKHSLVYINNDIWKQHELVEQPGDIRSILVNLFPDSVHYGGLFYALGNPTFEQVKEVLNTIFNLADFNEDKFTVDSSKLSLEDLRKACENTLCKTKFFRRLEGQVAKKELVGKLFRRNNNRLIYEKKEKDYTYTIGMDMPGFRTYMIIEESFQATDNKDYSNSSIIKKLFDKQSNYRQDRKNEYYIYMATRNDAERVLEEILKLPGFNINSLHCYC